MQYTTGVFPWQDDWSWSRERGGAEMKPINSVIVVSAIATAISGVPARAYEEGPVAQGGTIQGNQCA